MESLRKKTLESGGVPLIILGLTAVGISIIGYNGADTMTSDIVLTIAGVVQIAVGIFAIKYANDVRKGMLMLFLALAVIVVYVVAIIVRFADSTIIEQILLMAAGILLPASIMRDAVLNIKAARKEVLESEKVN